jgi:UDP-2,3-diacylglucosamine hydrolase
MYNPKAPVYFISDLHLDAVFQRDNPNRSAVDSFFKHLESSAGTLYILGDYFDFWFEYKHVLPVRSLYGLHRLMSLREQELDIHYITGNHDGWAKNFFQKELQIPVYHDPLVLECPPYRVMLLHGDGLRSGEGAYRLMRRVIRHPMNQWLFRWFHPDLGVPLARRMSRWSKDHGPDSFDESTDSEMQRFYEQCFHQGIDIIMMGHNHRPSFRAINDKAVIVLGDWLKHFSYAVYDGQAIRLEYWKER